ncbi:hypothetical protein ASPVEDRAFT_482852 [Aspergillus versicolor CBS 583.65]|uniref:Uncharacterized protein n=1 Tax=Aspergillus versicolor CBS 583.65 TaxID=1036611 RepID=A0A1L9PB68_ASPVE|nr:uncharacterized protein ASPVEDRAFT_482852 [Aspergillus versicolor CBS 583.65]OJI98758.1 hypothetical protein ASPVEDRAFT_482852 [Aspergillus versicolor CBS 583.65]
MERSLWKAAGVPHELQDGSKIPLLPLLRASSTPGCYLPKSMLLSLVEALGHYYNDLLEGANQNTACGDENLLLKVGSSQIKKTAST